MTLKVSCYHPQEHIFKTLYLHKFLASTVYRVWLFSEIHPTFMASREGRWRKASIIIALLWLAIWLLLRKRSLKTRSKNKSTRERVKIPLIGSFDPTFDGSIFQHASVVFTFHFLVSWSVFFPSKPKLKGKYFYPKGLDVMSEYRHRSLVRISKLPNVDSDTTNTTFRTPNPNPQSHPLFEMVRLFHHEKGHLQRSFGLLH